MSNEDDLRDNDKKLAFEILTDIDRVLSLGHLARTDETDKAENMGRVFLATALDKNSILGRSFDIWNHQPAWKLMSTNGYATKSHLEPLDGLRGWITKYLDELDSEPSPNQHYVKTGEVYTGRKVIRSIVEQAQSSIDIQDNYLDHTILSLLEPLVISNSSVVVRLLTDRVSGTLLSDLPLFLQQYNVNVELKKHKAAHGRFIFIDKSVVYSTGSSLKDHGKKGDIITKVEIEAEKNKLIADFENWWQQADSN